MRKEREREREGTRKDMKPSTKEETHNKPGMEVDRIDFGGPD
jgi:hypothetical protein